MDNKYKIILYLAKKQDMFTLHELSRLTQIPYTSFYRTIQTMDDVVNIRTKGKSKLIKIKWNEITRAYLTIASFEEKKEFLQQHTVMRKIDEKARDIAMVFGSYAKGNYTKHSDIDIMVINDDGKRTVRFSGIEMLYDIKVNPLFFSREEFLKMLQDDEENVGKQAMKDHVLISGFGEFWKLVEHEVR
ncbi:MAG: nucleotidyltransferase domain-containing protein [Candidatus Woesearchaeota archaeon]